MRLVGVVSILKYSQEIGNRVLIKPHYTHTWHIFMYTKNFIPGDLMTGVPVVLCGANILRRESWDDMYYVSKSLPDGERLCPNCKKLSMSIYEEIRS